MRLCGEPCDASDAGVVIVWAGLQDCALHILRSSRVAWQGQMTAALMSKQLPIKRKVDNLHEMLPQEEVEDTHLGPCHFDEPVHAALLYGHCLCVMQTCGGMIA